MTRPIFFLTDFGLADTYVGVVKAVMLGIAPGAPIVDLTHGVAPQDIRAGAFALLTAAPYLPDDAVVLAVVDPGVGTARRAVAVQIGSRTFVGPDNGLLSWAIRALAAPGAPRSSGTTQPSPPQGRSTTQSPRGAASPQPPLPGPGAGPDEFTLDLGSLGTGVVLDRPRYWRPTVSATFHGRDLFGPVAAHLAQGVLLSEIGSPTSTIRSLPFPPAHREVNGAGHVASARGEVIHVDRFGNAITNLAAHDLPADPIVDVAGRKIAGLAPHFQASVAAHPPGSLADADDTGDLIALIGSTGLLEIAVPNGSAAAILGLGIGTAVVASKA